MNDTDKHISIIGQRRSKKGISNPYTAIKFHVYAHNPGYEI